MLGAASCSDWSSAFSPPPIANSSPPLLTFPYVIPEAVHPPPAPPLAPLRYVLRHSDHTPEHCPYPAPAKLRPAPPRSESLPETGPCFLGIGPSLSGCPGFWRELWAATGQVLGKPRRLCLGPLPSLHLVCFPALTHRLGWVPYFPCRRWAQAGSAQCSRARGPDRTDGASLTHSEVVDSRKSWEGLWRLSLIIPHPRPLQVGKQRQTGTLWSAIRDASQDGRPRSNPGQVFVLVGASELKWLRSSPTSSSSSPPPHLPIKKYTILSPLEILQRDHIPLES